MTIDEAREILGDDAVGMSDDAIRADIKTATLFKDIFFSSQWTSRRQIKPFPVTELFPRDIVETRHPS